MGIPGRRVGRAAVRWLEWLSPPVGSAIHTVVSAKFELWPPRRTFALGALHAALKRWLPFRGGFFVEFGANDGLSQSNTAYLERYQGWHGLLIEAAPTKFAECVRNRPGSIVVHAALVPPDYRKEFVTLRYANLMTIVSDPGLAERGDCRLDRHLAAAKGHIRSDEPYGVEFMAPASTLGAVLDAYDIDDVDFMSVDVEGLELAALSGLDFDRVAPKLVLIEARDPEQAGAFFGERGYHQLGQLSHHDYLFGR